MDVQSSNFSKRNSSIKEERNASASQIIVQPNDRMYTVDSGASRDVMEINSLTPQARKTITETNHSLDIHTLRAAWFVPLQR